MSSTKIVPRQLQISALQDVIKALAAWGFEYNLRMPLPDETVYPEHVMSVMSSALNQRGLHLPQPVKWTLCFGDRGVFTISFDGEQWSTQPTEVADADVRIETTPQTWATFVLSSRQAERQRLLETMRVSGEQERVNELLAINWIERQP